MCAPKNPEPTEDSPSSAQPIYRSNIERMPEKKRGDKKEGNNEDTVFMCRFRTLGGWPWMATGTQFCVTLAQLNGGPMPGPKGKHRGCR